MYEQERSKILHLVSYKCQMNGKQNELFDGHVYVLFSSRLTHGEYVSVLHKGKYAAAAAIDPLHFGRVSVQMNTLLPFAMKMH